nr:nsp11 [Murine hepatitis virus]YP_009924341.1 nsp11 [Murine hepatitis virus]YP_009924367.1 nsp11 [Rat coronavirus Parker]YP_209254.1 nsp11 [Murine hepatitis virus strain JHM]
SKDTNFLNGFGVQV